MPHLAVERDVRIELMDRAVHAGPDEALLQEILEEVLIFPLLLADERGEDVEFGSGRKLQDAVQNFVPRLGRDGAVALGAVPLADAREEDAEIVVDFRDRADRRAGIIAGRLLRDGNRG